MNKKIIVILMLVILVITQLLREDSLLHNGLIKINTIYSPRLHGKINLSEMINKPDDFVCEKIGPPLAIYRKCDKKWMPIPFNDYISRPSTDVSEYIFLYSECRHLTGDVYERNDIILKNGIVVDVLHQASE